MKPEKRNGKKREVNFGVVALIIVGVIILLAIAMTVVMFAVSVKTQGEGGGDIASYLAIFAILITLISIVVPITSYITNKDEVRKLSKEFAETSKNLQEQVAKTIGEKSREFDAKTEALDIRYTELLESIVRKNSLSSDFDASPYVKAHVGYVNALLLFENGAYDKCENIIKTVLSDFMALETEAKNKEDCALLLYKSLNLYRKLANRMRFSDNSLFFYEEKIIAKYLTSDNALAYKVAVYMYVASKLDKIEKSFDIGYGGQAISELDSYIEILKPDAFYYNAMLARKYYIIAYYDKRRDSYKQAIESAVCAYNRWNERKNFVGKKSEAEKRLDGKSAFEIAKILEKSGFSVNKNDRQQLLETALEIVEELIRNDKNCKYFLELSEILKKMGRQEDSDCAAEYGLSLSPTDPLLAAQCAYIYLRKYLSNEKNVAYLNKAEECIGTAYWVYNREKKHYKDKSNSKFSYIASLHATIAMYELKQSVCDDKLASQKTLDICNGIENSISDNPNNVPNYKRALLIYFSLAERFTDDKENYLGKIRQLIVRFKENDAFNFKKGEAFKEFADEVRAIDVEKSDYAQLKETFKHILQDPQDNI